MISHSLARNKAWRCRVDLTSTGCVLASSEWTSWYRSISKVCVLLTSENHTKKYTLHYLRLGSIYETTIREHDYILIVEVKFVEKYSKNVTPLKSNLCWLAWKRPCWFQFFFVKRCSMIFRQLPKRGRKLFNHFNRRRGN